MDTVISDVPARNVATDAVLGPVDEFIGYHMRRASAVINNDFARSLAGTGMRQVLFAILSIISANRGIKQGAAGSMLGIQRANMVSLINELVAAGWIERRSAPADRRAFSLTITPDGETILALASARIRVHEERLLAALSTDERRLLIELLGRIEALEA